MPRDAQIQVRRDTSANWTSTNPVLAAGEFGHETDTGLVKIGDGTSAWTALQYLSSRMNDWASGQDSTSIDVFPRFAISGSSSISNGQLRLAVFTATKTLSVTNIAAFCGVAGTDTGGTTYRRMALYTISGTTITLVARTANTTTMFNSTGKNEYPLDATGGYVSSYTVTAGTRYAVGAYCYNTGGTYGAPSLQSSGNAAGATMAASPRLSGVVNATNDLPTTNQTVTDSGVMPFFRLT